ncbi:MAG: hypothetical protein AAB320_06300, partial [Elusimicrobiota bacterium]
MIKRLTLAAALVAGFLGAVPARAQSVPSLISFQGRLTDNLNNPLGGSHTFIFNIYPVSTGGAALWTETQAGVAVSNGVLAVQLGAVTPLTPAVFSGAAAFLEVTVDGTPLSPRERLITVPYAFNSQQLQGRDFAAFVSTDAAQSIAGAKTFTGAVVVPTPAAANQAATKGYVDAFTGGASLLPSTNTFSGQNTFVNLVSFSSDVVLTGALSRTADLNVGGAGYKVTFASGVVAGWFYGNGAGITGLKPANIVSGSLGAGVIASSIAVNAVGGENIAAGAVETGKLAADSVTGVKILNATIDTAKLNATIQAQLALAGTVSAGAIDTGKLAADSVTGAKILNATIDTAKLNATIQAQLALAGTVSAGAIDTAKLAVDAVTTAKILDLNVTAAKLAAGAVDTGKLAADSVTGTKILNATIDTAKLNATIQAQLALAGTVSAGAIDTAKLAVDAVTTAKILDLNVTTGKLAAGAVDTGKLAADSVT